MRVWHPAACDPGGTCSASLCPGKTSEWTHPNRSLTTANENTSYFSRLGDAWASPYKHRCSKEQNTGVVMIVLKKSDAKIHRPIGRSTGLPMSRSGRCSAIKMERARNSATPFAEDFYWEHSSTSLSVVLMTLYNGSDSVVPATPQRHMARSIDSPTCVYVG